MTVLWPDGSAGIVPPRVTSEFGMRTHPVTGRPSTMHYGIDLIGWSIIKAPASGVISFAGYNGGAGNEVRLRADNGDVFRLFHNRELWVRTGQRVNQGDGVAVMGTTGSSTGVHCHEETRPGGGAAINPRDYYAKANAGTEPAGGGGTPLAPEVPEEDEMTLYFRPTGNSSPDPKNGNLSRIWAGDDRVFAGVKYSGTWILEGPESRRLTSAEWLAVQRAYAAAGRKVPVASVTGNEAEIIVYAPRIK